MPCLWSFFLCLLQLVRVVEVEYIDIYNIQSDLKDYNVTCSADSCDSKEIDSFSYRSCLCGVQCVQLGACCIDAYYTDASQPKFKPLCRPVYKGKTYYLVDQCSLTDSVWASLCNDDWNGDDDIQKLVPVTSLLTLTTYKNYYCFRCYETTDEFLYWIVRVQSIDPKYTISETENKHTDRCTSLIYNNTEGTWMVLCDENVGYFPVTVSLLIPKEVEKLIHVCVPDIVSNCSEEWSDEEVKKKCHSYMALKTVIRRGQLPFTYKNIHCALCNFESLNDISCWRMLTFLFKQKITVSFTYLLDINRSDGELVGKTQKCSSDHMWDPYTKKCRKLTCALPGFTVKNGKCAQE